MKLGQNSKNFIWNLLGSGINCMMSFLFTVLVMRVNGEDASGAFSICLSVSIIFFSLTNLGNRVFEISDHDQPDGLYFTLKIIVGAAALVLAGVLCPVLHYNRERFFLIELLVVVRIIESFSDTLYAVLQRNERLDLVGISYVVKNTAVLAGFIVVDCLTHSLKAATVWMLAATLAVFLLFDCRLVSRFGRVRPIADLRATGQLFRKLLYFICFNLILIVMANIPRLITDRFYTEAQMAYFSVIMMIPTVMALLGQFVIQPFITALDRYYSERDFAAFARRKRLILWMMAGLAVLCSGGIAWFGPPVLGVILGKDLRDYRAVMVLAIVAGMFSIMTTFLSMLLTIMRKTGQQLAFYAGVLAAEFIVVLLCAKTAAFLPVFIGYGAVMAVQFVLFDLYFGFCLRRRSACNQA